MVKRDYDWEGGVDLKPHTARKLKVLREYFEEYLRVRCQHPQQERFKLCIVDGFAGGGRYKNGEAGSPIVFMETLVKLSNEINLHRAAQGMKPLEIGCRLILNDVQPNVVGLLRENLAPLLAAAKDEAPHLVVNVEYLNKLFEEAYPEIRQSLLHDGFRNVLFNLDQYGHAFVRMDTLNDILQTFRTSGEVFLTFGIKSLLTYLQKSDPKALLSGLKHLGIRADDLAPLEPLMSKKPELWISQHHIRFVEGHFWLPFFQAIGDETRKHMNECIYNGSVSGMFYPHVLLENAEHRFDNKSFSHQ